MVTEIDIWRSAKQLVDQYGEDASLEAAIRADRMLEQGDLDDLAGIIWTDRDQNDAGPAGPAARSRAIKPA